MYEDDIYPILLRFNREPVKTLFFKKRVEYVQPREREIIIVMMCRYEGSHETSLQSHKAVITFGFSELKICMYHLPTQGSASPEVADRSATSGEAEPCVGRWHVYNVGLIFFFFCTVW